MVIFHSYVSLPEGNVSKTIINRPFGNGLYTTYKNGDDWGVVYEIVLPTLYVVHGWKPCK
jgi:hypothetical protein